MIDFHFSEIWLSSFANDLEKSCGRNYKKILAIFRPKFSLDYYFGEKDSLAMEKHLIGKIKKNPEFGRLINKNIIKFSDGLNRFGQKISKIDLAKLSQVWSHGSIVSGLLMDKASSALTKDPDLSEIAGVVPRGETEVEMEWLATTGIPHPVIEASVKERQETRQKPSFIGQVIAALRREFGGHKVKGK